MPTTPAEWLCALAMLPLALLVGIAALSPRVTRRTQAEETAEIERVRSRPDNRSKTQ